MQISGRHGASAGRRGGPGLLALALLAACGSGAAGPERPRGIVLILLDTVRADRLTVYDPARATTPALATLAARGTVFEQVQAAAPWTVPSVASLWTGLAPTQHGAGIGGEGPRMFDPRAIQGFDEGLATLPARLRALGYRTYGRISNELLAGTCFTAGFDEVEVTRARAPVLVDWALQRLPQMTAEPFFLYLHFMDAHVPLAPPERTVRRFLPPGFDLDSLPPQARNAERWGMYKKLDRLEGKNLRAFRIVKEATYDAALATIDEELARLLSGLESAGALADTLFVVTADHGEEFWDHWEVQHRSYDLDSRVAVGTGHGHSLFQELLHVPLFLAGPRVPAGRRVATRVRLQDLGSTLLELVTGSGEPLGEGETFAPLLTGTRGADRPAFAESLVYGYDQRALVDADGFKLIHSTRAGERELLYDLAHDPGETNDLLEREPARAAALRSALETLLQGLEARRAKSGAPLQGLDLEHLRDLGYGGDGSEER